MSKEIEWSIFHGEGDIVCSCDQCGEEHRVEFDESSPDYKKAQSEIEGMGWQSARINGEWCDFCCSTCRNNYIRENI